MLVSIFNFNIGEQITGTVTSRIYMMNVSDPNSYHWINTFIVTPPSPSSSSKPLTSPTSSSPLKTLAIALPCAIGGMVIGAFLIFMCYQRKKRQTTRNSQSEFQDLAYSPSSPEFQGLAYRPNSDATSFGTQSFVQNDPAWQIPPTIIRQ